MKHVLYWIPEAQDFKKLSFIYSHIPGSVAISQNHRMTELQRLEGTFRDHGVQSLQSRPPAAGCTSRCPGGSWIEVSIEGASTTSLGSLFSALSPSLCRSSFAYWCGTFCAPVYGHFPLSCPHRPWKRGWPCPFDSHT